MATIVVRPTARPRLGQGQEPGAQAIARRLKNDYGGSFGWEGNVPALRAHRRFRLGRR